MRAAHKLPIYDNCYIYSPDGVLLCRASAKRMQWYINKGLAHITGDKTIHLSFTPKGPGYAGDKFHLQTLANWCVVCGAEEGLVKYYVVPRAFRRYFPDSMKNHSNHDVVPMCTVCVSKWEPSARRIFEEMCMAHDVDPKGREIDEYHYRKIEAKSAAIALQKYGDKIPEQRKKDLQWKIDWAWDFYKYNVNTDRNEDINALAALYKPEYVKPGDLLVQKILKYSKLEPKESSLFRHIIAPWRASFIAAMSPKYMPLHWDVCRIER